MRRFLLCLIIAIAGAFVLAGQASGFRPKNGFVPDQKTAVSVAEAVLAPIYGEKQVASERPFSAQLDRGVWTITGNLPVGWDGGVAEIKIRRSDAAVISVTHGK